MKRGIRVPDGFYRLVKLTEDQNPIFPGRETVVEVRGDEVINLSTRRGCKLSMFDAERALYGPIKSPFDVTPIDKLPQIHLGAVQPTDAGSSADD